MRKKLLLFGMLWLPLSLARAEEPVEGDWLDGSRDYLGNRADNLAVWMDDFFGTVDSDVEAAESRLRLYFINEWEQGEGNDFGVRVRGKVQLPKVNKRVSLVFAGEDGDEIDDFDTDPDDRREDRIGLQYKMREGRRSRVDLTANISSGPYINPGVRYRYQKALNPNLRLRLTEQLKYEGGDGFLTISRLDLDRALAGNALLRWGNRLNWGEDTDGVEWRSKLSWRYRYAENRALNLFTMVRGVTRPDSFVKRYGLGVRFRRQIYKDYLFVELEPAHYWVRKEFEDSRESVWALTLRFEVALEKDRSKSRRRPSSRPPADCSRGGDSCPDGAHSPDPPAPL